MRNIPYGSLPRQVGDLSFPTGKSVASPVLLIHGGAWRLMSKEALEPVARLFNEEGRIVFSINYRLIPQDPWPACGNDCVEAARFVLGGGLSTYGVSTPEKLLICGASAGGHLALMTGLALTSQKADGIISLAGPSRVSRGDTDTEASAISGKTFLRDFFGGSGEVSSEELRSACPSALAADDAPPLRCIHSRNDRLVPPEHSIEAVASWQAAGVPAAIAWFDGADPFHGFWTPGDLATRDLIPEIKTQLRQILAAL